MNVLPRTKRERLFYALMGGASLRDAERYAGVSRQTALTYRLKWGIPANTQNRWRDRWIPNEQQIPANET